MIRVTIWNEYRHEVQVPEVAKIYPRGIHNAIGDHLKKNENFQVRTATLDEPENGLTEEVLNNTDVLIWWGHLDQEEVLDEVAERVYQRVIQGMGFIVLHSGHASKPFRKLCGTECQNVPWREAGEKERLWKIMPSHPILKGIEGDYIEIPHEEMYGEPFCMPAPQELILISWFEGGDVFRSGFTLKRGNGNIFYFRPGHEAFPVFYQKEVLQILENAVEWAAPPFPVPHCRSDYSPLEPIKSMQASIEALHTKQ